MFVSREYVKYYVFWHGPSKILSSVYKTWSLKEQCVVSSTYQLIAVITSSPLSLGNHNELGKNTVLFCEFYNWVHVKSYHNIPHVFPKKHEIYIQGSTVLCKYDYLYVPRPRQENWNQPHHGHAAFMKGYWKKSKQRGSYVQSLLTRYGAAGWVSTLLAFTCSIHRKLPT